MGPGTVWGLLAAESLAHQTGSPSGLQHNSRCSTDVSPTSFPDHNYLLMAHINANWVHGEARSTANMHSVLQQRPSKHCKVRQVLFGGGGGGLG